MVRTSGPPHSNSERVWRGAIVDAMANGIGVPVVVSLREEPLVPRVELLD